MFWNSKAVRIAVGLLLLGAGLLAIMPGLTGYTSLDGTVNARFAIISAPIEGRVQNAPPKVGTYVEQAEPLLTIRNERINRAIAASLSAELETARNRLKAFDIQRAQLQRLREELAARLRDYQQASIGAVEQEIAALKQRAAINDAQLVAANAELQRRTTLGASGIVAGSSVEQARAAQATSMGQGRVAVLDLERLTKQLEALKRGVFLGDGRNDVPYSRQRQDEVTIQLADLDARTRENEERVAQIERQLTEERDRIKRLEVAEITMPLTGVIWRNNVVEGSNVVVGNELSRILDCRDLFVDILVSEVDYDEIYPGRSAEVRLLGRGDPLRGAVISVRGSAAVVEEVTLAAMPPQTRGRNARIRVALDPSPLNMDFTNFCQVGRSVQVRFESARIPLRRWISALWFSIT
ncbi:MAG TPA: HlyD family efflux transporter periplasmic adaptor subunit [Beijerinckiaceae bacterium]|jgi:multidrug resistance efflux pump